MAALDLGLPWKRINGRTGRSSPAHLGEVSMLRRQDDKASL